MKNYLSEEKPSKCSEEGEKFSKISEAEYKPLESSEEGEIPPSEKPTEEGAKPSESSEEQEKPSKSSIEGKKPSKTPTEAGEKPSEGSEEVEKPPKISEAGEKPSEGSEEVEKPPKISEEGEKPSESSEEGEQPSKKPAEKKVPLLITSSNLKGENKTFTKKPVRRGRVRKLLQTISTSIGGSLLALKMRLFNAYQRYDQNRSPNSPPLSRLIASLMIMAVYMIGCAYIDCVEVMEQPVDSQKPSVRDVLEANSHGFPSPQARSVLFAPGAGMSVRASSMFIKDLTDGGYQVIVDENQTHSLTRFKVFEYDAIILFIGTDQDFSLFKFSMDELLQFFDAGGSIMLAIEGHVSPAVAEFISAFNLFVEACNVNYTDLFSHHEEDDEMIWVGVPKKDNEPFTSVSSGDVLFKGCGNSIEPGNFLANTLLPPSSYVSALEGLAGIDSSLSLITAFQGRNNARLLLSGSVKFFSDDYFALSPNNRQMAHDIADWCFHKRGVLRYSNLKHYVEGGEMKSLYHTNDIIEFNIDIHEYIQGSWRPYKVKDLQLDYTMLEPHVRVFLEPSSDAMSPTYAGKIKAPDRFGVFSFIVDYLRSGYTLLHVESKAPVDRPKAYEKPRLLALSPYYSSVMTLLIGFFFFAIFFNLAEPTVKVKTA